MDPTTLLCSVLMICSPQPTGDMSQVALNAMIGNLKAGLKSVKDARMLGNRTRDHLNAAIDESLKFANQANAPDYVAAIAAKAAAMTQTYAPYAEAAIELYYQLAPVINNLDQSIPQDLAPYNQVRDGLYSDILAQIASGPGTGRHCAGLALVGLRSVEMNFLFALGQQLNGLAASLQDFSYTITLGLNMVQRVVVEQFQLFRPDLADLQDASANFDATIATTLLPMTLQSAAIFTSTVQNVLGTLVTALATSGVAQTAIGAVNSAFLVCLGEA